MHSDIYDQILAMFDDEPPWVTVLSTTVCILHHGFSHFHWTGFYVVSAPNELSVGPYQGGHGCLRISFSQGICGAAAHTKQTQWVRDVHTRPEHIACSATTQSEVVVPVLHNGCVVAVLDVDSDILDAFSQEDVLFLEAVAQLVGQHYAAPFFVV